MTAVCAHPSDCDEIGNQCSWDDCPFGLRASATNAHPLDGVGDLRNAPTTGEKLLGEFSLAHAHVIIIANVSSGLVWVRSKFRARA